MDISQLQKVTCFHLSSSPARKGNKREIILLLSFLFIVCVCTSPPQVMALLRAPGQLSAPPSAAGTKPKASAAAAAAAAASDGGEGRPGSSSVAKEQLLRAVLASLASDPGRRARIHWYGRAH